MAPSLGLVLATCASPSLCDPDRHEHDHDRARHAREHGEVRPVEEILAAARAAVAGEVVGLELEREHGHWVYEIKMIGEDGRVLEVVVDGADARVLHWEPD
ncbi:hypothetical protein CKO23_16405 [Thiocystis violacea]|nr:PepSY domain-containing protein [Thiocystis violacea]MBK1723808.1 hypothetical protein [Thiocystis violacea]